MNAHLQHACRNCGAELNGPWCSQCGQKDLRDEDRRFGHLLGQFAHEVFHVDGKLPRTIGALLFKPGKPGQVYLGGQRARYMSPIGLFLIVNLLYFLAPPMTDFNVSLEEQYSMQPYSSLVQPLIDKRLEERELERSDYARVYDQTNLNLARSLIILHIPFLALALKLLMLSRPWYFAEHFVIAIQLFTALLIVTLMMSQGGMLLARLLVWLAAVDISPTLYRIWSVLPILIVVHWSIAIWRSYAIGWLFTALSTVAVIMTLVVGHFCYRAIQFLVVFSVT